MKRFLSVSLVAVLAVSPMVASADDPTYQGGSTTVYGSAAPYTLSANAANDGTNVVTASYVKGAYNDLTRKINKVAADKQNLLSNGAQENSGINSTVQTSVRASGTASDNYLVTEKAVRDAIVSVSGDVSGKQNQLKSGSASGSNMDAIVKTTVATGVENDETSATSLVSESAVRTAIDNVASDTMTLTNKTIVASSNSISGIATTNMDGGAIATSISASPVDTKLASEKAVSDALALKQNSLTNGAASGGEISSTVKTSVATTNASDNDLVTEKAVRDAITAATTTAGMVMLNETQTLTNKTINADNNTISELETDNFKSGVVQTSVRVAASASDTALASEKAVRTALDNQRINILAEWGSNTVTQTTIAPTPTQQ